MEIESTQDVKQRINDLLEKGTLSWDASQFLRATVKGTVALALGLSTFLFFTQGVLWALAGLFFGIALSLSFFGFVLTYSPYQKAKQIEDLLPEALELLSSNLKAGLTTREALKLLITDQYEPLASEISLIMAKESMGMPLEDALIESTTRIESDLYRKVLQTVSRGIAGGSDLEEVTKSLATNIQDIRNMKQKIRSAAMGYKAFLTFSSLIAAPFLFALSTFLIKTLTTLTEEASAGASAGAGIPSSFMAIGGSLPPVDTLTTFFISMIILTSVSTSIGVGIVSKGHIMEGVKMSPIFITVALLVYWIGGKLISVFIGGVI